MSTLQAETMLFTPNDAAHPDTPRNTASHSTDTPRNTASHHQHQPLWRLQRCLRARTSLCRRAMRHRMSRSNALRVLWRLCRSQHQHRTLRILRSQLSVRSNLQKWAMLCIGKLSPDSFQTDPLLR